MLKRLLSLILITELILQPIFTSVVQASDPRFKEEGTFKYYQVTRPSDARKLDLPADTIYASDLDLTLMQCQPGNRKYEDKAFAIDDHYIQWIQEAPSRWFSLTARWPGNQKGTHIQLDQLDVQFLAIDTIIGKGHILHLDPMRFCEDNIFFACEEDSVTYKGKALKYLLQAIRNVGKTPPPIAIIDDNLDELRQIYQDNPDEKLTLVHLDHKAVIRGYPTLNSNFPETIFDLTLEKGLFGGHGGVQLMRDEQGRPWIFKPMRQTHELFGELAYRGLGEHNPDLAVYWHLPYDLCGLISLAEGPFRLAEYVDPLPDQSFEEIYRQSSMRLVVDAFFLNHDSITTEERDGKTVFLNQILGQDNLLHPVDLGACGIYYHEGRHEGNQTTLMGTIEDFREYPAYQYLADTLPMQLQALYKKLPAVFRAFEKAKQFGMCYGNELEQFLGDRARMLELHLNRKLPHFLWGGPCLSGSLFSGAGVFILCGDDVVLGIRKNGQEISNLGGFFEAWHRYPHVTAAVEVHEESAGGISIDPRALLQCSRLNYYYHKQIQRGLKTFDELFRYTMYFYPMENVDVAKVNEQLRRAVREEERELEEVIRVPFKDLMAASLNGENCLPINAIKRQFFEPFAMSMRGLAFRQTMLTALLSTDNPHAVDILDTPPKKGAVLRPLRKPLSGETYPDPDAKMGLHLTSLMNEPLPITCELPQGTPFRHVASHLVLNKFVGIDQSSLKQVLGKALLDYQIIEKPDLAFESYLFALLLEEGLRPDLHVFSHGTSGSIGFQWLILTTMNRVLGNSSLRLRAREEAIMVPPSAYEFAARMAQKGVIETHYDPGHQDSWMAVALSLFHCLNASFSSPIRFFYRGQSRTQLGNGFPILAEMYSEFDLDETMVQSLIGGYERIYSKHFQSNSDFGCLLQVSFEDARLDDVLYLAGDDGLAVTYADRSVPRPSDYIRRARSGEAVDPVQARFLGQTMTYEYKDLRGQLSVSPKALQNARYKFHFWPPIDQDTMVIELENLIRTHLYMVMPQLVASPNIYKQLPPVAEQVRQQMNLLRAVINMSGLAYDAAVALCNDDLATVLKLLSTHKSMREARFFVKDLGETLTLEEFAARFHQAELGTKLSDRLSPYINYLYNLGFQERLTLDKFVNSRLAHLLPFQKVMIGQYIRCLDKQRQGDLMDLCAHAVRAYHTHSQLQLLFSHYLVAIDIGFQDPRPFLPKAVELNEQTNTKIDATLVETSLQLVGFQPRDLEHLEQLIPIAVAGIHLDDQWHAMSLTKFIRQGRETLGEFMECLKNLGDRTIPPSMVKLARGIARAPEDYKPVLLTLQEIADTLGLQLGNIFDTSVECSPGAQPTPEQKEDEGAKETSDPTSEVLTKDGLIDPRYIKPTQLPWIAEIVKIIEYQYPFDYMVMVECLKGLLVIERGPNGRDQLKGVVGLISNLAQPLPQNKLPKLALVGIIEMAKDKEIALDQQQILWTQILTHIMPEILKKLSIPQAYDRMLHAFSEVRDLSLADLNLADKAHPLTHLYCQALANLPVVRKLGPIRPELLKPFLVASEYNAGNEIIYEEIRRVVVLLAHIRHGFGLTDQDIEALGKLYLKPLEGQHSPDDFLQLDLIEQKNFEKAHPELEANCKAFRGLLNHYFNENEKDLSQIILAAAATGKYSASDVQEALSTLSEIEFHQTWMENRPEFFRKLLEVHPKNASDKELQVFRECLLLTDLISEFGFRSIFDHPESEIEYWKYGFMETFLPVLGKLDFNADNVTTILKGLLNYACLGRGHSGYIQRILDKFPTDPAQVEAWAKGLLTDR